MTVDREKVISAALDLLDDVGLDGLTLRRLGERLGIQAPTLYWHVKNKQALLDAMATRMLRDMVATGPPPAATWEADLTAWAATLRATLRRRRDGAKVLSGTYVIDDSVLEAMEPRLRVLVDAGFTLAAAVSGWSTLYGYVVGFVIEEQAAPPDNARYRDREQRLDASRFPLAAGAGAVAFGDPDARFADGVSIIVAGMLARRS